MHYVFIELCHYSQWDCLNFQHYFLLPRSNTQRCVLPAHGWRREGLVVHVLAALGDHRLGIVLEARLHDLFFFFPGACMT